MSHPMRRTAMQGRTPWRWLSLLALIPTLGADGPTVPTRTESIVRADGGTTPGRLVGDPQAGFRFEPTGGGPSIPLEAAGVITCDGPTGGQAGSSPNRVELGLGQRISGRLRRSDAGMIRLEDGPGGAKVEIVQAGATGLAQRPGEALVLRDGWETLDPERWATIGEADVVATPHLEGARALVLPARGAAVTARLPTPVGSGRFEVAFRDPGGMAPGHQWFVDLLFRGGDRPESVRMVLDAGLDNLGVQSSGGPALAVQLLARKPGWHRLSIRFGPETEVAVDGNELAHGRGPGGPLVEIRLAHQTQNNGADLIADSDMVVAFDDLRLVRVAEPVGNLEVAPLVDDVRLIDGDQVFGRFRAADGDQIRLEVDGRVVQLPWTEVASVQFRREPTTSRAIDGLLVRVEWRPGPDTDARDLDQVEGALIAANDAALTVATPYAGDLAIPRDRLRRIKVVGRGTRIMVDPFSHHLGNNIAVDSPLLDPPLPEGGTLDRTFTLDRVPDPATAVPSLALDVVQVIGEAVVGGLDDLPALVRAGQLRTNILINGTKVDYLNRHVSTQNEAPERVRLAIPPGLLRVGANTIRFEQTGKLTNPEELDDLGILGIAIEFAPPAR